MAIVRSRGQLIAAAIMLLAATALIAGCSRYCGGPEGFSTHPYCIQYPGGFTRQRLPQMAHNIMALSFIYEEMPVTPKPSRAPAVIYVRCHRMAKHQTAQAFMERYYDELAARHLGMHMARRKGSSGAAEWEVTASQPYLAARVIVLPKERLAYDVVTSCPPSERARLEKALRRTRNSFRLEPIRPK